MRCCIVLIVCAALAAQNVGADNSRRPTDEKLFTSLPAQLFGKSGKPFIERGYENHVGFICKAHNSTTADATFCNGLFRNVTKDCRAQSASAACFRNLTKTRLGKGASFLSFKAKNVKSVEDMLDDFGGCCEYVEVDQQVAANACPSPVPWGLDRVDEGRTVDSVPDYYPASRGSQSIVFVIDTGIYSDHNEFKTATGNKVAGAYSVFTLTASAPDGHGHGTHVSGTVAGQTYGVAKDALLYGVKVLDDTGSGSTSGVIAGISHMSSKCAPASSGDTAHPGVGWFAVPAANGGGYRRCVGSMSLGGGFVQSLNDAVRDAVRTWNVPMAVAAGNDNADAGTSSPASAPDAITVGASDSADVRASFSNYGKMVDVYAPGVSVLSSYIGSTTATATMSGTSMATPHVSGAVALLLSTDTTLKATSVVRSLLQTGLGSWVAGPDGCRNALLQVRRAATATCDGDAAAAALNASNSWLPSPCGSCAGVSSACPAAPTCTAAAPRAGGCDCTAAADCASGVCDAATAKCTAAAAGLQTTRALSPTTTALPRTTSALSKTTSAPSQGTTIVSPPATTAASALPPTTTALSRTTAALSRTTSGLPRTTTPPPPASTPPPSTCGSVSSCSRGDLVCDAACCNAYGSTYYSSRRRGNTCICRQCITSASRPGAAAVPPSNPVAPSNPAPGGGNSRSRRAFSSAEAVLPEAVAVAPAGATSENSAMSQTVLTVVGLGGGGALLGIAGFVLLISRRRTAAAHASKTTVLCGVSKSAPLVLEIHVEAPTPAPAN